MSKHHQVEQTGSVLLEVMISILIFSFGVLGIVGLLGNMISSSSESKYRSEAGFFVNRFLGEISASDRSSATALAPFQSPGGARFVSWYNDIKNTNASDGPLGLPGADTHAPTITITPYVNPVTGLATSYDVSVVVQWAAPGKPTHKHEVHASISAD